MGISPTLLLLSASPATPMPEDGPEEKQQEGQDGDPAKVGDDWDEIEESKTLRIKLGAVSSMLSRNRPNYKSTSIKTITEVIKFSHLSPYNSSSPMKSRGISNQLTYKPRS
jgi:hypothetical protein